MTEHLLALSDVASRMLALSQHASIYVDNLVVRTEMAGVLAVRFLEGRGIARTDILGAGIVLGARVVPASRRYAEVVPPRLRAAATDAALLDQSGLDAAACILLADLAADECVARALQTAGEALVLNALDFRLDYPRLFREAAAESAPLP